jgi:imidazolonepropionase-like amidohydrolase
MLAIKAGQLIDGTGHAPEHRVIVLVDGERIIEVGPEASVQVPPDVQVIDAGENTVMPGLIDAHVHIQSPGGPVHANTSQLSQVTTSQATLGLRALSYAQQGLDMGITTMRSLSSPNYVDVALRDAINEGLVEGPRLKVSGQGLTVTGGHMDKTAWAPEVSIEGRTGVADGPWGLRKAARAQFKNGVDLIKINAAVSVFSLDYSNTIPYRQEMTYDEMTAICEEAHWAGKRVAAHAHGGQGITDALRAGLDSVEHGVWLTEEQVETMARQGTFYVPTLLVHSTSWRLGPAAIGHSPAARNWLAQALDARWISLERARKAGVKIATGTDAGFRVRHGESAGEIEELTKGGCTPMQAIEAATRVAAECLDMAGEVGTIERGKYADLIVVAGDPLADVRVLQSKANLLHIFKGGRRVGEARGSIH